MEDCKLRTSGRTDPQKKVGLNWPHPQEACQQHHQAGSDLESTGGEKEGKAQEHLAQGHRGRYAGRSRRRQARARCADGLLYMALAPHGAKGLSK